MMAPYYLDACGVSTALMPVRSALPSCLCLQFCPHACVISTALMSVRSALPSCLWGQQFIIMSPATPHQQHHTLQLNWVIIPTASVAAAAAPGAHTCGCYSCACSNIDMYT